MKNVPGRTWQGSSVAINGPAIRLIRQHLGMTCFRLAQEIGMTPDYVRKIERGFCRQVSPEVFRDLCHRLRIDDRRAILADPWREDDETLAQINAGADAAESTQDEAASAG